jgi:hypothetical protein
MIKTSQRKRAFNSPLMAYANCKNGKHINLIKLSKPYANGDSYAIVNTLNSNLSKMYKTASKSFKDFEEMVLKARKTNTIINRGYLTCNF